MEQLVIPEEAKFWVGVSSALVFSTVALMAFFNDFNWWQSMFFGSGITIFFASTSLAAVILFTMASDSQKPKKVK